MADAKVFVFKPADAIETGAAVADGVQKVLDDYVNLKTVNGITSYVMLGNLYVVVTTA